MNPILASMFRPRVPCLERSDDHRDCSNYTHSSNHSNYYNHSDNGNKGDTTVDGQNPALPIIRNIP